MTPAMVSVHIYIIMYITVYIHIYIYVHIQIHAHHIRNLMQYTHVICNL